MNVSKSKEAVEFWLVDPTWAGVLITILSRMWRSRCARTRHLNPDGSSCVLVSKPIYSSAKYGASSCSAIAGVHMCSGISRRVM
jgi:hypothetical protein